MESKVVIAGPNNKPYVRLTNSELTLRVGEIVEIQGIGGEFSGEYVVKKVKHTITTSPWSHLIHVDIEPLKR